MNNKDLTTIWCSGGISGALGWMFGLSSTDAFLLGLFTMCVILLIDLLVTPII